MGRKVVGKGGRGNRMKREEEENVRETRGKKRGRGGKYRGRGKEREVKKGGKGEESGSYSKHTRQMAYVHWRTVVAAKVLT